MSIGLAKRFAVFQRDAFQCRYCARRPPEVRLHADHVHPRAKGGTNHISNLVTACHECNMGKKAELLTAELPPPPPPAPIVLPPRREALAATIEAVGFKQDQNGILTPPFRVAFAHLHAPDTAGEFSDGKYKFSMRFTDDEAAVFEQFLKDMCRVEGLPKSAHLPFDGTYFRAKTKQRPFFVDATGEPLQLSCAVEGGTAVRALLRPEFFKIKSLAGINLYIKAVQFLTNPDNRYKTIF